MLPLLHIAEECFDDFRGRSLRRKSTLGEFRTVVVAEVSCVFVAASMHSRGKLEGGCHEELCTFIYAAGRGGYGGPAFCACAGAGHPDLGVGGWRRRQSVQP